MQSDEIQQHRASFRQVITQICRVLHLTIMTRMASCSTTARTSPHPFRQEEVEDEVVPLGGSSEAESGPRAGEAKLRSLGLSWRL